MPRLVAYKHPVWTGRIVRVTINSGWHDDLKIDGVTPHWTMPRTLIGHVIGRDVPVHVRWQLFGEDGEPPGLPPWAKVISEWTGEDADAWRASFVMLSGHRTHG